MGSQLGQREEEANPPVSFEARNTGVTLEAEPTVGPDGTIILKLIPQVVEFLGFVDIDSREAFPVGRKTSRLMEIISNPSNVPEATGSPLGSP